MSETLPLSVISQASGPIVDAVASSLNVNENTHFIFKILINLLSLKKGLTSIASAVSSGNGTNDTVVEDTEAGTNLKSLNLI